MIGTVRVRGDECWASIAFCDACTEPHDSPIFILEHPVRIEGLWATFYAQCPKTPRTIIMAAMPNGAFRCSVRPRMENPLIRQGDDKASPMGG